MLPIEGYITVRFPAGITIVDTVSAASNCESVANLSPNISCEAEEDYIRVNNGIVSANLASGTEIKFSVGSIKNPPSTSRY